MLDKILLLYLLIINAAGFLLMLIDKWKAKKNLWRIPEWVLFTAAAVGGSVGTVAGMYLFRHKTKHWYFWAVNILGLVIHVGIFLAVLITTEASLTRNDFNGKSAV